MLHLIAGQERLVVLRHGRIRRVAGPGLALVVPPFERAWRISMAPTTLPLVVHAMSRDAVPLTVFASVTVSVVEPWRLAVSLPEHPEERAAEEVEAALARAVNALELSQLVTGFRPRPEELSRRTMIFGVEVESIAIDDVEARVAPRRSMAVDP